MNCILVVDDDPAVRELLGMYLGRAGYQVCTAEAGPAGVAAARERPPALLLLDIMLPGCDGYEVCRRVRTFSEVPIVFLTCRDDDLDVILGLEMGADDYITKPFNPREVVARVKAVLRRADGAAGRAGRLEVGPLRIDEGTREVAVDATPVRLTRKELDILCLLARHPRVVFSRAEIMRQVWDDAYDYQDVRTVDTHVKRVRRKLADAGAGPLTIEAVWGTGYRLVAGE